MDKVKTVDTIHDAGSEDPSAAIQYWLQEQKEGQPRSNPKDKQRRRKQKTQKHHPKQLLNSPALACP